jgi:hypothetical protein
VEETVKRSEGTNPNPKEGYRKKTNPNIIKSIKNQNKQINNI